MKRTIPLVAIAALFAMVTATNAQLLYCNSIYTGGGGIGNVFNTRFNPSVSGSGEYAGLLGYSLLIVLAVFTVIGIVYAIGYSLRIEKLISFSRAELLEGFFTLVVIVAIVGGIGVVDSAISLVSNIGIAGLSAQGISAGTVSSASQLYTNICNNLQTAVGSLLSNMVTFSLHTTVFEIAEGLEISVMPRGNSGIIPYTPGFSIDPFKGLVALTLGVNFLTNAMGGVVALEIGVSMMLAVIFYLFPIFLYLGVALRSFPWTRAAGGAFIALFISFYIFFPAILYPFTVCNTGKCGILSSPYALTSGSSGDLLGGFASGGLNFASFVTEFFDPGLTFLALLYTFVAQVAYPILNLAGVAISFIIAMDLMELLGDLLGAPSLSRRTLLQKVI